MRYLQTSLPLVLGRSQLIQRTGRDQLEKSRSKCRRTWEYASRENHGPMDMATCMTNIVLSAIESSDIPLQNLSLPMIQVDKLHLLPNLGRNLELLQRLKVDIGLSVSRCDYHLFPSELSEPNIFTMINDLPCLEYLELFTWPLKRLRPESLSLYPYLPQLKPLQVRTLHLVRSVK